VEVKWNGKMVRVFLDKGSGWQVVALEGQYIPQEEKIQIIKAVLTNV
jgi:hypothetical protein